MENTSLERKDIALITVLQQHFKGDANLARVELICLFITALCKVKTINYDRLASGFDTKAKGEARTEGWLRINFSSETFISFEPQAGFPSTISACRTGYSG